GEDPPHRLRLERARPEPSELAWRTRQDDDDARSGVEDDPGSRAGEPERERAFGQRRLLPDARGAVGVRAAEPAGERARAALDRGFELVVDGQRPPRDTGHELDRAVVVRRTEPARDETEIGRERLAERGLEVVRRVSHDGDAPWLEPQPHGF